MIVNINHSSLTPKQKEVLDFIDIFVTKNDYFPSLNEIAKHLNKSISTVQHFIEELKIKGYLDKNDNKARGIRFSDVSKAEIFKLGYIAAGSPIEPIENPELISVPSSFINPSGNYYALEVKGESMRDEGILDGDTIIVKHQIFANDGDRIVAVTENGATLKVFRKRDNSVYLEPRNKNFKFIYPKSLEIRGKFVGLIRKA